MLRGSIALLALFLSFPTSVATADPLVLTSSSLAPLVVLEPLDPRLVLTKTSLTGDRPSPSVNRTWGGNLAAIRGRDVQPCMTDEDIDFTRE